MRIILFAQIFAALTVLGVAGVFAIPFLLPELGAANVLLGLIQFEAVAVILSAGIAYALPMFLGIMKGENVLILTHDPIRNRTIIKIGKALETRKKGQEIKVTTGGDPETGIVQEYSGIVTPARVRIKPEENIKVI